MAGSLSDFKYTTDTGLEFAVRLDDSNTLVVNKDVTSGDLRAAAGTLVMPVAQKLRHAIYRSDSGLYTIRAAILTQAQVATVPATITVKFASGGTAAAIDVLLRLQRTKGESFSRSKSGDTGQTN